MSRAIVPVLRLYAVVNVVELAIRHKLPLASLGAALLKGGDGFRRKYLSDMKTAALFLAANLAEVQPISSARYRRGAGPCHCRLPRILTVLLVGDIEVTVRPHYFPQRFPALPRSAAACEDDV